MAKKEMNKRLSNLLQGIDLIDRQGDLNVMISGLTQDSRKVREGDLFIALRGFHQDGHMFVDDAIRRGAAAILTENAIVNRSAKTYVRVADSRKALAKLAGNFYGHPADQLQLIGVTGTSGKTTTTLLIESILKHNDCRVGSVGTLAYRWADKEEKAPMTTPDAIELNRLFHRMRLDGVTHVAMEVSSHALSLGRVDGCRFKVGVFTNLSQDHLDFHQTMEDYFNAKALLFRDHLSGSGETSVAVINGDDIFGRRLIEIAGGDVWSYSVDRAGTTVWKKWAEFSTSEIRAEFVSPKGSIHVRSSLLGRLNLYNLLAAAATGLALGISPDVVEEGLAAVNFVDGRLQRVSIPERFGFEVVVDYSHKPDAMEKSLSCLKEMSGGRLLVVFGCGGDRDRGKRPIMGEVAARLGDLVILTSDNPRSEDPEAIIRDIEPGVQSAGLRLIDSSQSAPAGNGYFMEADRKKAIELALSLGEPGDLIFIGGKGHETYQIIGDRVVSFDDRVVVQDYFASLIEHPSDSIRKSDHALDSRKTG